MTKQELRVKLKAARNEISREEHASKSEQICGRVSRLVEAVQPTCVHVYLPMFSEVDTWPLVVYAQQQLKVPVYVPHVVSKDRLQLQHALLPEHIEIEKGILQTPTVMNPQDVVSSEQLHEKLGDRGMVIVPMLGFSTDGSRLGYGGGFYDVFLAGVNSITIGVAFDLQKTSELTSEQHDVRVSSVITESQVHQCL